MRELVIELRFKGTPYEFGVMVFNLPDYVRAQYKIEVQSAPIGPASNPVIVKFGDDYSMEGFARETFGWATATRLPNGQSQILVECPGNAPWSEIEESWESILDEMKRLSWLDVTNKPLPPIPTHKLQERRERVREMYLAGKYSYDEIGRATKTNRDTAAADLKWLRRKKLMP